MSRYSFMVRSVTRPFHFPLGHLRLQLAGHDFGLPYEEIQCFAPSEPVSWSRIFESCCLPWKASQTISSPRRLKSMTPRDVRFTPDSQARPISGSHWSICQVVLEGLPWKTGQRLQTYFQISKSPPKLTDPSYPYSMQAFPFWCLMGGYLGTGKWTH